MLVFGLTATLNGRITLAHVLFRLPTVTLDTTLFVVPSIIDTVLSSLFATYTILVSGLTAIPVGVAPTVIFSTTLFVVPFITDIVLS
jgi:hypothetical protein